MASAPSSSGVKAAPRTAAVSALAYSSLEKRPGRSLRQHSITAASQGLAFVHFSVQLKRILWDMGAFWVV